MSNIFEMSEDSRKELLWEENEDFEQVDRIFVDHKRWEVVFKLIFKHIPTGKYYSLIDNCPATVKHGESQENEYRVGSELIEVEPKEETHTIYINKETP